jgi:hypothetical protein
LLAGELAMVGGACSHQEPVYPFIDAGDPCATSPSAHPIDCAQFAETTCVVEGETCPREIYGCADASYFTAEDYSQCPPEAGGDVTLLGDGGVIGTDAPADSAGEGGDATSDAPAD